MPAKLKRCQFNKCVAGVRIMPFVQGPEHCRFCDRDFCGKHRYVESHECPNIATCKEAAYEANAAQLNKEATQAVKVA